MNKVEIANFLKTLEEKGLLIRISKPVDPKYEISTLMKMLDGRVVLFDHVNGFSMPVVANVCSTRDLVAMGLGTTRENSCRSSPTQSTTLRKRR